MVTPATALACLGHHWGRGVGDPARRRDIGEWLSLSGPQLSTQRWTPVPVASAPPQSLSTGAGPWPLGWEQKGTGPCRPLGIREPASPSAGGWEGCEWPQGHWSRPGRASWSDGLGRGGWAGPPGPPSLSAGLGFGKGTAGSLGPAGGPGHPMPAPPWFEGFGSDGVSWSGGLGYWEVGPGRSQGPAGRVRPTGDHCGLTPGPAGGGC